MVDSFEVSLLLILLFSDEFVDESLATPFNDVKPEQEFGIKRDDKISFFVGSSSSILISGALFVSAETAGEAGSEILLSISVSVE